MDDWTGAQKANLVARILAGELTVKAACDRHSLTPERIREWVLTYRRSAREALDVQLAEALARQGIDTEDLNAAEFSGPLADIPVAELLQTVALGRKDAVIVVSHGAEESRIWCVAGQIVDAESGRLTGELAVYRILGIDVGHIQGDFRAVQRVRVVHVSSQALLLEAARRKDESALLLASLGDPATIFVPAARALAAEAPIAPALLGVLRQFNPGCSVGQVLESSDRGDLETLSAISTLVEQRYLVPDQALTVARLTLEPAQPTSEPSQVNSLIAHATTGAAPPERSMSWLQGTGLGLVMLTSLGLILWAFGMHRFTGIAPSSASRPERVVALPPPIAPLEAPRPSPVDDPPPSPVADTPVPSPVSDPPPSSPVAADAPQSKSSPTAAPRRPRVQPAPGPGRAARRPAAGAAPPPVVTPPVTAAETPVPVPPAVQSAPQRQPGIQRID